MHLPSTQQMQVQMEDCLSRVWTNVENGAEAVFQLAFAGDLCRNQLAITNQFRVSFCRLVNANDMFLGDNQHVGRRLRLNVLKGKRLFVFVNFFGRNFSRDDLAEEAVSHNREIVTNVFLKSRAQRGIAITEKMQGSISKIPSGAGIPTLCMKNFKNPNLDFLPNGNLYTILLILEWW